MNIFSFAKPALILTTLSLCLFPQKAHTDAACPTPTSNSWTCADLGAFVQDSVNERSPGGNATLIVGAPMLEKRGWTSMFSSSISTFNLSFMVSFTPELREYCSLHGMDFTGGNVLVRCGTNVQAGHVFIRNCTFSDPDNQRLSIGEADTRCLRSQQFLPTDGNAIAVTELGDGGLAGRQAANERRRGPTASALNPTRLNGNQDNSRFSPTVEARRPESAPAGAAI